MKKWMASIVVLVVVSVATVVVYGGFYSSYAEGTIYPAAASASLTCYVIDNGYQFATSNTSRRDILATFVRKDTHGHDVGVCFLRTPNSNPEWVDTPPVSLVPQLPTPVSCPGYPTQPFPFAVCMPDGGWRDGRQ